MLPVASLAEVWLVDFEFCAPDGEPPSPLCMAARELKTGRLVRAWRDELHARPGPPFAIDRNSLIVAYYASAEIGCSLALGWPMPANVLDLCAEFKCVTSGLQVPCHRTLLGALAYYNLPVIDGIEKNSMRQLAMRGGHYTEAEKAALLDYCQSDVDALAKLIVAMDGRGDIDFDRALLRGRYMAAAARMELTGVPIDVGALRRTRDGWTAIQDTLIAAVDVDYNVFEGRTFKADRFADWLRRNNISWPLLESGALDLSRDAFHEMARVYPAVAPMAELRHALSELRLNDLAVGRDGRNRCLLSAFASKTGRNQPSNSKFIFGPAVWLRSLIKPEPGRALAYIDYEQQEFAIGAALSGDEAMMAAYASGDPYLAFAKQARAVPQDATRTSHKTEREQFKICALAVQYGMGAESLARRLQTCPARAQELLDLHRRTYPRYWTWSDAVLDHALLRGHLHTRFGWKVHAGAEPNPRSLRNFPMQGNGAEILRLACIALTEAGIAVCAPVHDAVLIEAGTHDINEVVVWCQQLMCRASQAVLGGFPLRTEVKIVRHPDRYTDPRGTRMWETVNRLLGPMGDP